MLKTTELGLTLLVGAEALDRRVERVLTATLRDPTRYLSGGEFVLSGLEWWRDPEDAETFVHALAEAGVVALGAGTAGMGGTVPDHLIAACRRHGVALLAVAAHVSFATVSEKVILGLAAERASAHPAALERWHRRLVATVSAGGGLATLLVTGATELQADCWVLSATGQVIAGTGTELSAAQRARLVRRFLRADRLPTVVTGKGGAAMTLLSAAGKASHRAASWFLAVNGDHRRWAQERSDVATEFAGLIALERSRLDESRRIQNRAAEPLLRLVLSDNASLSEIRSRLSTTGIAETDPIITLSASATRHCPVITEALLASYEGMVGAVDGEVFGLLRGPDFGTFVDALRDAVRIIEPTLGPAGLAVGVSRCTDAAGLRASMQEARHARKLAEVSTERAVVVAGDEVASHLLLLAAVPDELRRSFRTKVLGPLLAYDAEHKSDLVQTLRVFLEHSGSWARTSAALHVHVNTLRYRATRIAELTGRDLNRFPDRVDLYLALIHQ